MTKIWMLIFLVLSSCCEQKHDAERRIELYRKCNEADNHITVTYCEQVAEEGSRVGECEK